MLCSPSYLVTSVPPFISPSKAYSMALPETWTSSNIKYLCTFSILNLLIFRLINRCFNLIGIFCCLGNDRIKNFASEIRTHFYDFICSIFKRLPSLFCLWLYLSWLSLLYLWIQIISCFLYTCFHISANYCKDWIEKFARSGNYLLDIIWIIDLFFF